MTIQELLHNTDTELVMNHIKRHYGDREIPQFEALYRKLQKMAPNENRDQMTIFITAVLPGEENDEVLEVFDESDETLDFDVSATKAGEDTIYSITASSYSDYLGFFIEEKTLRRMSYASILAHTLWEITAYSFEDL